MGKQSRERIVFLALSHTQRENPPVTQISDACVCCGNHVGNWGGGGGKNRSKEEHKNGYERNARPLSDILRRVTCELVNPVTPVFETELRTEHNGQLGVCEDVGGGLPEPITRAHQQVMSHSTTPQMEIGSFSSSIHPSPFIGIGNR